MFKLCVLEDRFCNNCGECNYCDLKPTKICDNCCECIDETGYRTLKIDKIVLENEK